MRRMFGSRGVLWVVAVGSGFCSAPFSESAEYALLRTPSHALQAGFASQNQQQEPDSVLTEPSTLEFVLTPSCSQSPLDESGALPLAQLLAPAGLSMESRAALNGAAALGGMGAMVLATGEGGRIWMLLAVGCVYHADPGRSQRPDRDRLDLAIERHEDDFDFVASSVRSVPRSLKELVIGPLRRRHADRAHDTNPLDTPEMLAAYPTPGATGLALIAGGCALARRRR